MGEVINIGAAQFSGHVLTHLYNKQESHIPYKPDQKLIYDNNVFLSSAKVNGRTNYSPRSIIFDVKNGFGSLGRYDYYDPQIDIQSLGLEVINTTQPLEKNLYQQGLDKGKSDSNLLSVSNTKFWSDYNKLIFKPRSLVLLDSWQIDNDYNTSNRFVPNMKFDKFNLGTEEFNNMSEDVIDNFRKLLEESDYFQGLQVSTELDNSWGGFTTNMISTIKDEFFNYTSNNKFTIWVFGYLSPKFTTVDQKTSRIQSLVELSRHSSVLFPLQRSSTNFWQNSTDSAIIINSIWEILNDKTTVMKDFESTLLNTQLDRNIVNNISIHDEVDDSEQLNKLNLYDMNQSTTAHTSCGFNKKPKHIFSSNFITNDEQAENVTYKAKNNLLDITKIDTFPKTKYTKIKTEFSIDSSIVYDFKQQLKALDRVKFNEDFDDKRELMNDLHNLKTAYYDAPEFEYDSDSD